MAKSQDADELLALLADLTAGQLTDSQTSRLAELLRDNPDAQRRYVEHLSLHARLHLEYSQGANVDHLPGLSFMPEGVSSSCASPPAVHPAKRALMPVSLASVLLAAAVLALVVNVTFFLRQPSQKVTTEGNQSVTERASSNAPAESGVAVLTTAVGVQWSQPADNGKAPADLSLTGPSPAVGAVLRPGRLQLDSGLVQLEFYSGVTVVLEGPADFEIVSSMKAICRSGRLRAHVPRQAEGFQIETPSATLVDLGTEFGVRVDPTGQAEVHVFAGKVQVYPESGNRVTKQQQDVSAGNGLRIGASDALQEIPLSEGEFVTVAELQQKAARSAEAHFDRWRAYSKRLKLDSRVLLYYTFEEQTLWDRMLVNRAGTVDPKVLDGAIVGCQWSVGRWPEKNALDFKRPSDRIRIQGPIHCDSMTFAAWIRLDALQEAISALLLTDRYEEGNPHWQITQEGQLALGVSHGDADIRSRNKYRSPPVFGPDQLGTWTHVATVYDHSKGLVTHYVNGQSVSRQEMLVRLPLRIEAAEIANWVVPRETGAEPIRNFNGRIDEFLLFREALEPHEIRQMYEAGRMDELR